MKAQRVGQDEQDAKMPTKESAHFREIIKPKSCDTCANKTWYVEQGWDECTALSGEVLILWSKLEWTVCDCWSPKHVPTEREKVIAKLSAKDREILGL
jgi:hypothetical protein